MIAFKASPALQRVMMPGAPGHVFIHMQVSVRQDVEPSALLVANQYCHRILKFFAKPHVEHTGVERASPHAQVKPARTREGPCGRAGENQVGSGGEHSFLQSRNYTSCNPICIEIFKQFESEFKSVPNESFRWSVKGCRGQGKASTGTRYFP